MPTIELSYIDAERVINALRDSALMYESKAETLKEPFATRMYDRANECWHLSNRFRLWF